MIKDVVKDILQKEIQIGRIKQKEVVFEIPNNEEVLEFTSIEIIKELDTPNSVISEQFIESMLLRYYSEFVKSENLKRAFKMFIK